MSKLLPSTREEAFAYQFEDDLATDVLEIITVFSVRLYGSRSHRNKILVEQLKLVAKELK